MATGYRVMCNAPLRGHQSEYARAACPVCGPQMATRPAVPSVPNLLKMPVDDRVSVASLPELDDASLIALFEHDKSIKVATALAKRQDLPADVMEALATHEHDGVRNAFFGQPDRPPELAVAALAAQPYNDVQALASNRDQSADMLRSVWAARTRFTDASERSRLGFSLLRNPNTPSDVFADVVRTVEMRDSSKTLLAVAIRERPDALTVDDIRRFSYERASAVRMVAAESSLLPVEDQRRLFVENLQDIDESLAVNPSAPRDLLDDLWNRHMERAAKTHDDCIVRLLANPNLPVEHLVTGARVQGLDSENEYVEQRRREAALSNPSTPGDVIQAIASDANDKRADYAAKVVAKRICADLGIDPDNTEAIEFLREQEWYSFTRESPQVELSLSVFRN